MGTQAIGCITRADETGIWVVRRTRGRGRWSERDGVRAVFRGNAMRT
jgi:hypothetical protein